MSHDEHADTPQAERSLTTLLERAGSSYEPPPGGFARIQALMHAPEGQAAPVSDGSAPREAQPDGAQPAGAQPAGAQPRGSQLPVSLSARRGRRRGAGLMRPWVGGVAAALVGVLVLGGGAGSPLRGGGSTEQVAGGGGESADLGYSESFDTAVPPAGVARDAAPPPAGEEVGPVTGGKAAPQPASDPLAPAAPNQPAAQVPARDGALVVREGSMEVVVERGSLTSRVGQVETLAKGLGGYVSQSAVSDQNGQPGASLTLRVPAERFPDALAGLRRLGEVQSEQSSARDVTGEVRDLDARLKALQQARSQYLTLLAEAENVGEILSVQQRIDEVQSQIETLTAQTKTLRSQAQLSSVQLRLYEKGDAAVFPEPQSEWERAWAESVEGFTSGIRGIIASSGRVLLIGLCALAGWGAFRLLRRQWRRRQLSSES